MPHPELGRQWPSQRKTSTAWSRSSSAGAASRRCSGRARLHPDGHGEPKGCRQARPQNTQSTVNAPPPPPRPPLGHLCPRGPTLSAPPELPEGGGVPPVSVSGRGASLRVSSPEPGGPSARDSAYSPTLLPSEAPARARPPHRRGQWAASGRHREGCLGPRTVSRAGHSLPLPSPGMGNKGGVCSACPLAQPLLHSHRNLPLLGKRKHQKPGTHEPTAQLETPEGGSPVLSLCRHAPWRAS